MKLLIKQFSLLALLLMLAGGLAACKPEATQVPSQVPGISIGITDGICPNVIVNVGDQVTWTNQGKSDHIVRDTPLSGLSQFNSGMLGPGDSFAFTFTEAKIYNYTCSTDGTMKGMVTVNP